VPLHLEIVDGKGLRTLDVERSPFTIGRSSENQLQLADAQVSRRHAELVNPGDGWRIRDCGSRFGTYVNDAKVEDALLRSGDRIRIGQAELRVGDGQTSSVLSSAAFDFRQVNALLAGLRALGSSRVLDEVLAIVLDCALEATGAERGFILLADKEGKLTLSVARARGGISIPSAQTSRRIPEEVFATGKDRIVTDLLDEAHAALHTGTVALGIRHVLCTPLNTMEYGGGAGSERRIGVLYLDSRERGYLQHAGALHALAAEAAVVIENARLYREVVERERAAQELRIAAQIQQALLPPGYHAGASVELAAMTTPCRAVGGDFFDYVAHDNGRLTFAVGDVAGKGTSAALLTAVVQGLFAAEAETKDQPALVLTRVNKTLCRRAVEARFVTAFYGEIDSSGDLRYCNAGHNPPFLLSSRGVERLETGGAVLGLFDFGRFETGSARFGPGDSLVLFSDGVTEAENAEGEEFGDERLLSCLTAVGGGSATEIRDAVQNEVRAFSGSTAARDDVTVMVVKAR
jgi:serine phosphatase RsbU (regulator of sigma subunit)